MAKSRTKAGEPKRFFESTIGHTGSDCVIWPFFIRSTGYPGIMRGRVTLNAHRLMCEAAHGPCPSSGHQAAHSCGNRACINPQHLRWATVRENAHDKYKHGTMLSGEKHGRAKLTEKKVRRIRQRIAGGEPYPSIASDYGVSRSAISEIARGKNWASVGRAR